MPFLTTDQKGLIDVLLEYYLPRMDKVCWLRPRLFHNRQVLHLRIDPAVNHQKAGGLMADDLIW